MINYGSGQKENHQVWGSENQPKFSKKIPILYVSFTIRSMLHPRVKIRVTSQIDPAHKGEKEWLTCLSPEAKHWRTRAFPMVT